MRTSKQTIDGLMYDGSKVLAALAQAGFAVVPKEPTREMWSAGANAVVGKTTTHHDRVVDAVWTAMIEKAPR